MSQATQSQIPAMPPGLTARQIINDVFSALYSNHSGTSAPSYATSGTVWLDTSASPITTFKVFNGTVWTSLYTVNMDTQAVTWVNKVALSDVTGFSTVGASLSTAASADAAQGFIGATTTGKALLTAASASDARTTLGLGTSATMAVENLTGLRNLIINGGFRFWQRGTSFAHSLSGAYTADRWQFGTAAGSGQIERSTDTPGSFFAYSLLNNTAGDVDLSTPLELEAAGRSNPFIAGEKVTLSFWCKAATTDTVSTLIRFADNTAGTNFVDFSAVDPALTFGSTWERKSVTFTIPSAASTNVLAQVIIYGLAAGSRIAGVQLERGEVMTPFDFVPVGSEFDLCQRYYQVYTAIDATTSGALFSDGGFSLARHNFPCTMRTTPTLAIFDAAGNANRFGTFNDATYNLSNTWADGWCQIKDSKGFVNVITSAGAVNNAKYIITASAEF